MRPLVLKLIPQLSETIMSFVSRLAAKNGPSFVQDFCLDMGLKWQKLIYSDVDQINKLATVSDICPIDLGERALTKIDDRRCLLNGQLLATKSFLRADQKICPLCVSNDEQEYGEFGAYGRREWLLASFRVCPTHNCELVALPRVSFPRHSYDFYRRYEDSRDLLKQVDSYISSNRRSAWEKYLLERLSGRVGTRWIDQFDLDATMRIVQNFGIILAFGSRAREASLSGRQLSGACEVGFMATSGTQSEFELSLRDVQQKSLSTTPGFHADFAMFARWCTRVSLEERYCPLINLLADFAFQNYPMAKGEEIFGRACTERKWHNSSSAAKSYGSGPSRMSRLLEGLDIGQKKEGKPRVFQVEDADRILPDVLRCIPRIECIRILGVHHDRFDRFVAKGIFRPKYQISKVAPLFDPEDINRFLSEVRANSHEVSSPTKGLLSIKTVCNAAICQFEEILPKLLAGELTKTEWVVSERGLQALRLDLEDVRDAIEVEPSPDYSKEQLRSVLCVNGATVKMLIDSNQLRAVHTRHHRSRRPMKVVEKREVQNFLTKYVSLGELAKKECIQANWVAARLAKDGIHPISLPSQFSKLYLRETIEA